MLSVSLAKPDGGVFGGGVVGSLIASGPIQLIVASFKQNISKNIKLSQLANFSTAGGTLLADSEIPKFSIQIAAITEGEGNCTEAANTLPVSQQHMLKIDPQDIFQLPPSISGGRALSPDINSINNI
ncbi:hypothetical protein JCGZ_11247 [Jatropha curcas]|uniref:AT-hook motif nuclear-localized protein n=1 Tax=Jatropha curcas TaxID=180498 RepID=A0A067KRB1_JATCU|nr:AT-hook motif nuclear-localized protein 8-like [Jatropha curcas]KDP34364.1 hypothetical protein JCGZ_11247 [Jatropha curcas]